VERYRTLGVLPDTTARQAHPEAAKVLRYVAIDGLPQKPEQSAGEGLTFEQFAPEFILCRQGRWKPATTSRNEYALTRVNEYKTRGAPWRLPEQGRWMVHSATGVPLTR